MASKFGLAGGIPERKVRPIWDAIDSRQFKNALKHVSTLLAKHPNSPYALVRTLIRTLTALVDIEFALFFVLLNAEFPIRLWKHSCWNEWGSLTKRYLLRSMRRSFSTPMILCWWMISLSALCRLCFSDWITVSFFCLFILLSFAICDVIVCNILNRNRN